MKAAIALLAAIGLLLLLIVFGAGCQYDRIGERDKPRPQQPAIESRKTEMYSWGGHGIRVGHVYRENGFSLHLPEGWMEEARTDAEVSYRHSTKQRHIICRVLPSDGFFRPEKWEVAMTPAMKLQAKTGEYDTHFTTAVDNGFDLHQYLVEKKPGAACLFVFESPSDEPPTAWAPDIIKSVQLDAK